MRNYKMHNKRIRIGRGMIEIDLAWWSWGFGIAFDYYGNREWSFTLTFGPTFTTLWSNWEE